MSGNHVIRAKKYLKDNKGSTDPVVQMRLKVVRHMLQHGLGRENPVTNQQLRDLLQESRSSSWFQHTILIPLRESRVFLAWSSRGYFIPIDEQDQAFAVNVYETRIESEQMHLRLLKEAWESAR